MVLVGGRRTHNRNIDGQPSELEAAQWTTYLNTVNLPKAYVHGIYRSIYDREDCIFVSKWRQGMPR